MLLNYPKFLFTKILCFFIAGTRLRRKDGGVIALPSHFKVDDPEPLGYDANFGRRIIQNPDLEDQIVQASTLEEVKASRVRKRTFSASVISERTIQLKDEDDTNSVRNRGPEKSSETTTKKTTKGNILLLGLVMSIFLKT